MEQLYTKYSKRIFDYLYKYTNNEEVASDLMQDTFLSFYKSYIDKGFSEERSLMLLYTIAKNNSINYSKKFSTQKESSGNVDFYKYNHTPFEKEQE
ncbi:MAG: sigma-70 family RNA polymerase sigma factor, partial [Spirochaetota bacterium]